MSPKEVVIEIDLNCGSHEATVWTNDLSAMYVHENSAYST
jgi:glutamate N-acetyltransferase/amino-acid N-acetyltransferase